MKVLVTGATGFLGEYIVKELSEKGYKVIAFGRNEEKGRDLSRRYIHTSFIKGNFEMKRTILIWIKINFFFCLKYGCRNLILVEKYG